MKVLFIGGTGVISSACSKLAVEKGIDLYLLNRGKTLRAIPRLVNILNGDIRNKDSIKNILNEKKFDVVVNWIAYTPEHIETDLNYFGTEQNNMFL